MEAIKSLRFERWEITIPDIVPIEPVKSLGIFHEFIEPSIDYATLEESHWTAVRLWVSGIMLCECVTVDPEIRGGVPVLNGTRITIAQIIGEVADGRSIVELSEAFDLNETRLRSLFEGMAIQFDRPFSK